MAQVSLDLPVRVISLLERAIRSNGYSTTEIALLSGMKRENLRYSLPRVRPATLGDTLAILDAADYPREETLLLILMAGEDFALSQAGTEPARLMGQLFKLALVEITEQIGENIEKLRLRWAFGTIILRGKKFMQKVAETNRRDHSNVGRITLLPGA